MPKLHIILTTDKILAIAMIVPHSGLIKKKRDMPWHVPTSID
jgi:hypothetical protein